MPDIFAARAGRGCRGGKRASDSAWGCRIPSGFGGRFCHESRPSWCPPLFGVPINHQSLDFASDPIGYFQSWQSGWIQSYPVAAIYLFASSALLLSVALGIFAGIVRQKEWLRKFIERFDLKPFEQHDIPTAWDRVFSKAEPSWIIVTFKDQSQVTGWYGSESYVSSDPDERDLFISSTVRTNEKGELEVAENSGGVYIRIDEIKTIEFIAEPTISNEPYTDDPKA